MPQKFNPPLHPDPDLKIGKSPPKLLGKLCIKNGILPPPKKKKWRITPSPTIDPMYMPYVHDW
jgi:hypothetical protein